MRKTEIEAAKKWLSENVMRATFAKVYYNKSWDKLLDNEILDLYTSFGKDNEMFIHPEVKKVLKEAREALETELMFLKSNIVKTESENSRIIKITDALTSINNLKTEL